MERYKELLAQGGVQMDETAWDTIHRHMDLIREWNKVVSLVASKDMGRLMEAHVVDSLSLAPIVVRLCGGEGHWMDVGTGGGFPAIPVKIALPRLRLTLVERSERCAGFLRKVVGALQLANTRIIQGEFPACVRECCPDVSTARAVENPKRILRDMVPFLDRGTVFLCQSGDPQSILGPAFHVEHVRDDWSAARLRRGDLFLVRRTQP